MPWARPRIPLLAAAALDAAGVMVLAIAIQAWRGLKLNPHNLGSASMLLVVVVIYCSLGWLFGSYTLLKLRQVSWGQAVIRIGTTAVASFMGIALIVDLFPRQFSSTLVLRSNLAILVAALCIWSGLARLWIRHLWPQNQKHIWQIFALPGEQSVLEDEWKLTKPSTPLPWIIHAKQGCEHARFNPCNVLALSPGVIKDSSLQKFCQDAFGLGIRITSIAEMAERELQRIPPKWIENPWLLFSNRIDGQRNTPGKQLKRYADVVLSLFLMVLSAPVLVVVAMLVKLQDGGPVLYRQQRTGLLGIPFEVLKIRTMCPNSEPSGAQWSQPKDLRITPFGRWIRRFRLDELPQLWNVFKGDMSLIGPRPERPELEQELERIIPNYRLRYWIRPGLSGWAQVNLPYCANIQDSELKLSYDLFYLRNASFWLDVLILLKTIKTILKAAGR